MLIGMMSVLTVFGVSADSETTIFSGLNADDWDYTAVDGVFYFDSGILYNNCSDTTAAGRAITSKETLNLGKQFTASYVLGAKSSTSNYPTEVDYGIAFRVGESLEVLVYHDSKWGSYYNEVTSTSKSVPKAKITYNGAVIYDGVAVKRADGTTKLAAGINNSMTKGTYTVHYENGVLSLVYTSWNVPYEYLYTTAEDGSKTYGINLADLVPDFNVSQVINEKVSVSLICATAKDIVSLTSFSLSSVPAEIPSEDIIGNWNEDGSVTWALAADGTLTVSGTGAMDNSKVGRSPVQEYADRIKAVVIGDGITQIGSRAFRDMVNIESVTFGKDVTFINYEAFYGCTSLATVSLNEGITQISSLAFSNTAIASIELPSTLTKLDARVFKGCANLDNVVIPDSVTYTGYELFMNCTSLTTFKWSAGCNWFNSLTFGGCTSLTNVTVPKTVRHIKASAFADCTALAEVDFEDSDTLFHVSSELPAIASTAFVGCSNTLIVKAWSGSAVESAAGVAGATFQAKNDAPFKFVVNEDGVSCTVTGLRTNGATPTIPTTINGYTVTAIGDYAFRNNTTMTGINIADTVETIGRSAFQNTKISTTVHIPASVKTIGVNAFADCAELPGVTFYGNVTDIQSGAFANCPKLVELTGFIGQNAAIARNAFLNCKALISVEIGAGATLNGNVFSGCVDTLTIRCTEGSSAHEYAVARGFAYELI